MIILTGDNEHEITQYIKTEKEKLDKNWVSLNYQEFETSQLNELISVAATGGFGGSKLLVIRGEIKAEISGVKQLPLWKKLISDRLATNIIILVPSTSLLKGFPKCDTKKFELPPEWKEKELGILVSDTATSVGLPIPVNVTNHLKEVLGNDTELLVAELELLKLCKGDGKLNLEIVQELVPNIESDIFSLAASIRDKKSDLVLEQVTKLLNKNDVLKLITAPLITTFRQWLFLKIAIQNKYSDEEAAKFSGIKNPKRLYYIKKDIQKATIKQLIYQYSELYYLDCQINNGISKSEFINWLLYLTNVNPVLHSDKSKTVTLYKPSFIDNPIGESNLTWQKSIFKFEIIEKKYKANHLLKHKSKRFSLRKNKTKHKSNIIPFPLEKYLEKTFNAKLIEKDVIESTFINHQEPIAINQTLSKFVESSTPIKKLTEAIETVTSTVEKKENEITKFKRDIDKKPQNISYDWQSTNVKSRIFRHPSPSNVPIDLSVFPVVFIDSKDPNYKKHLSDISQSKILALDIECFGENRSIDGLHPWKGRIRLIQLFNGKTCYIVDLGEASLNSLPLFALVQSDRSEKLLALTEFFQVLKERCESIECLKCGHNFHYDTRMLATQLGIRMNNIACTMMGVRVYFGDYGKGDEEVDGAKKNHVPIVEGGYGLANLCKRWLGIVLDKTYQTSNWGDSLCKEQLKYAAYDPIASWFLYHKLEELYKDKNSILYNEKIRDIWTVENESILAAVDIELNGMPFNKKEAKRQLKLIDAVFQPLHKEWQNLCPGITYNQRDEIITILKERYGIDLKATKEGKSKDVLDKAASAKYPDNLIIKLRLKLRALDSLKNNLENFIASSEDSGKDGRVHTVYRTLTGFGRFSSGDKKNFSDLPNLQSVSSRPNAAIKQYRLPNPRKAISCSKLELDIFFIKVALSEEQLLDWFTLRLAFGTCFCVVDLAGAHGRIGADQAVDKAAIEAENDSSIDSHSKVAVFIAKARGLEWTWDYISKLCGKYPFEKEGYSKEEAKKLEKEWKSKPDASKAFSFRATAKNTRYGDQNGAGAFRIQQQIAANEGVIADIADCEAALQGCAKLFPGLQQFKRKLIQRLEQSWIEIDGRRVTVNETSDGARIIIHMQPRRDKERKIIEPFQWMAEYTKNLAAVWTRIEATAIKKALPKILKLIKENPHWKVILSGFVHDEVNAEGSLLYAYEWVPAINNIIGDEFKNQLTYVVDGRETNWKKLVVKSWADK